MKKVMYSIGFLSAMGMSVGFLFTILHMPGGFELMNYGFLVFALVFVPMLAAHQLKVSVNKTLPDKLRIVLGVLSGVVACGGVFLKVMHMPGANLLLTAGSLIFIFGFLPSLFFTMYKKSIS